MKQRVILNHCAYGVYSPHFNKGFSRPHHLEGKACKTGLCGQAWSFPLFDPMNKANFVPLQRVKYDGMEKNVKQEKKSMDCPLFLRYKSLNDACMPYISKILLKIKGLLFLFLDNGRVC